MITYSKQLIERIADEHHFIKTNVEKVLRLYDLLEYINTNPLLKNNYALKGGTAINLLFNDIPRLSVDIDLDLAINVEKEELKKIKDIFKKELHKFINDNNYSLSKNSVSFYALDSYVLQYETAFLGNDNIKIEINYLNRAHILPLECKKVKTINDKEIDVLMVNKIEIYASKINALYSRFASRDLFDVYMMIKNNVIDDNKILRKCLIFYNLIGGNKDLLNLNPKIIKEKISFYDVRRYLCPVLNDKVKFDVVEANKTIILFIKDLLIFTPNEEKFIKEFNLGNYEPSLLFSDEEIVNNIKNHPMANWRIKNTE